MSKKRENKLINFICILIIMIFGIALVDKIISNDTFFDLKTGESILKYGIDFKDHFSFIPNLTYIYHHWLYDLIILGIYSCFSYDGIFVLFLLFFTVFGISVFYINNKKTNKFISVFVSLFTMFITTYAFQMRVQSITYVLFFWEVYFLEKLYNTGYKRYSLYLILLSILIVNLHMPIWIFYLVLCLPYFVETIIYLLSKKFNHLKKIFNVESPNNCKLLLITFLILLFTGFISPLKLYPYTFFTKSLFNSSFLFISEMSKTVLYYWRWELILIIILITGMYFKVFKFKFRDFLLIMGLFLFSLIASRNVVYFFMFIPTFFIKNVNIKFKYKNNKLNNYIKKINFKIVNIFLVLSLISIYSFLGYQFYIKRDDYGISDMFPDKIVSYLKKNTDYKNIRIFNDFDYGSYLEFHDIPVFIDSRAEVYMKEFNGGYDIIGDYHKGSSFDSYKEIFNKYNIQYIVIYRDTDLFSYLSKDDDYELIYEENDETSYVLLKKI